MPSFNKVILAGHLTREPELAYTQANMAYCKGGIAVTTKRGGKEETCFVDFVAWGKTADAIKQYTKKGTALLIEGRLKLEQWESDGVKRSKHGVVVDSFSFLGGRSEQTMPAAAPERAVSPSVSDDIPF